MNPMIPVIRKCFHPIEDDPIDNKNGKCDDKFSGGRRSEI